MSQIAGWNQVKFDETLKKYLHAIGMEKVPNALNKKMFFVSLGAFGETPMTNPHRFFWDLMKPVTVQDAEGRHRTGPLGYIIAAKRASPGWGQRRGNLQAYAHLKKGGVNYAKQWQAQVQKKFEAMLGGRRRARAFIRVGSLSVIQQLAPYYKGSKPSYSRAGVLKRGAEKGKIKPAQPGWNPTVQIENTAEARWDTRAGFYKQGIPPLEKAFEKEAASMNEFLDQEFKEPTDEFNRENRH